jgi:DNA polymerase-3 subunit gamma/tau
MARHAQAFTTPELLRVIRTFNAAASDARGSWQPSLPLELAFIDALQSPVVETQNLASLPPAPQPARPAPQPAADSRRSPQPPAPQPPAAPTLPAEPAPAAETAPAAPQVTHLAGPVWQQILDLVRQRNASLQALLSSSTARYLRGDMLILSFASDILKGRMEKPENMEITRRITSQVFQREMTVRCLVDTNKRDSVPPGVDDDGMVAAALRDLGGELVDIN